MDIYEALTRSALIPGKIEELCNLGLIVVDTSRSIRSAKIRLTDKGERFMDGLTALQRELHSSK